MGSASRRDWIARLRVVTVRSHQLVSKVVYTNYHELSTCKCGWSGVDGVDGGGSDGGGCGGDGGDSSGGGDGGWQTIDIFCVMDVYS